MGYLYAQGTKIESGAMPVLNNTDISFSLRVKGWIFQQQIASSGDRRAVISAVDTNVTRTAWIIGILTQATDSSVTSVPQVKLAHHQYRHAKPTTGAKSAQSLSNQWDPLVDFDADKWFVLHWGGEGNTVGDKMWLKVWAEDAAVPSFVIDASTTLASTGELQTPTGDHKLVINPGPADDVGTTFGLTDAQIEHYEIDSLAIYQPSVEYTVGADLVEHPLQANHASLSHLWLFDETTGTTVPDQVGSEDLTVSTAAGGYYWAPSMGPSWDFDDNQLPTDASYETPDGTQTTTPGTGTGVSTATPAIQNGRMEGHRNGTNPDNNMRVVTTTGPWKVDQTCLFKAVMGTDLMPAGYFVPARAFAGPSLALRKQGAINDSYINIGVSYDNGGGVIEISSVFKSDSTDTATGSAYTVTDPIANGPIRVMFVIEPDGVDWRATSYAKEANQTWWREVFSKGGYPTAELANAMIRLTVQNGAGGNNLAHGSGEMQYYDDVNVDEGVWNTLTVQVTAGRTVSAERVGATVSQHSVAAERLAGVTAQRSVSGERIGGSNAMTWTINAERLASTLSARTVAGERLGGAQASRSVAGERVAALIGARTISAERLALLISSRTVAGERLSLTTQVTASRTVWAERLAGIRQTRQVFGSRVRIVVSSRTVAGERLPDGGVVLLLGVLPQSSGTPFIGTSSATANIGN